jgi:preprotein translocase subunit SecD
MKQRKTVLWFILLLTFLSTVFSLPKNYNLKFSIGNIHIDRTINAPDLSFNWGPFKINKRIDTKYGLDLSGGTHLVLEADMSKIANADKDNAFASAKTVVERRVNLYGLTEPVIQQSKVGGSYRIIVEIPGVSDVDQAVDLIGTTAQLSFYEEASNASSIATPSSYFDIWSKFTGLTGKNLKKADVIFDSQSGKPEVSLQFDSDGSKLFSEITSRNTGKTVAIFLDSQLLSAPKVNEPITGGSAVIQGNFSVDEAKKLSIALNAGALPVPLKVLEQRNIGATLGKESIDKSMMAGLIGISIVGLFMIVNYGLWGVVADVALLIYTLVVFALFRLIPVTLTLAGIAGFILSIGMAVDANILIF